MKQIRQKADPKVAIILVGNKKDLISDTEYAEGKALANSFGIPFIAVSAKSGNNIAEAFQSLSDTIVRNDPSVLQTTPPTTETLNVKNPKVVRKDTCC